MEAGKISNDQFEKIINYLQGSCMNMEEAIHHITENDDSVDEMSMTEEQTNALYAEIFLCDACGWWFETCEACNETDDCGGTDCENCCEEGHEE